MELGGKTLAGGAQSALDENQDDRAGVADGELVALDENQDDLDGGAAGNSS